MRIGTWTDGRRRAAPAVAAFLFFALPAQAEDGATPILRFVESQPVVDPGAGLVELSGLSFVPGGPRLWTVSDDNGRAFLLHLGGKPRIAQRVDLGIGDLEGVAFDPEANRLLAVSEKAEAVVSVADGGAGAVTLHPLREMAGYASVAGAFAASDPNDGLEGIAADPVTSEILVLKEKRPRLLLRLAPDLSEIRTAFLLTAGAGFAAPGFEDRDLDVSGIAVDAERQTYWILSDTGKALFFFDPDRGARRIALTWRDGNKTRRLDNPEGVALSRDGALLYVITDDGKHSRLVSYAIE